MDLSRVLLVSCNRARCKGVTLNSFAKISDASSGGDEFLSPLDLRWLVI